MLYISGEESAKFRSKMRSGRIGAASKDLLVLVEISLDKILEQINYLKCIIILDFRYFHANQSTGNLT